MTDIDDRLGRLESLVEQQQDRIEGQQETIREQRERITELEADSASHDSTTAADSLPVGRRDALKAGGLLALLFGGVGTASTDPQGQVGTSDDPLTALHTDEINGGVTGDTGLTDLTGAGTRRERVGVPPAPRGRDLSPGGASPGGDG